MDTRYFLEIVDQVVQNHLTASRADWSETVVPPALRQVDAETYATVVDGSFANDDGTYTPPGI